MDFKLELSPKLILDEKFQKDVKGYNAEEVDSFLDKVIQDYVSFVQFQKETAAYLEKLDAEIQGLSNEKASLALEKKSSYEKRRSLEIENASLHNKLDGIKPGDKATPENLEYISRINQLEDFLYSMGYDPRTLKKKS